MWFSFRLFVKRKLLNFHGFCWLLPWFIRWKEKEILTTSFPRDRHYLPVCIRRILSHLCYNCLELQCFRIWPHCSFNAHIQGQEIPSFILCLQLSCGAVSTITEHCAYSLAQIYIGKLWSAKSIYSANIPKYLPTNLFLGSLLLKSHSSMDFIWTKWITAAGMYELGKWFKSWKAGMVLWNRGTEF